MQSNTLQQRYKRHRLVICLLSLNSKPTDLGPALLHWSWTSASFPCHLGECCTSPAESNEVSHSPVLFPMKALRSGPPARPYTPWPDAYQKPLLSSSETQPSSKKTVLWSSTGQLSSSQSSGKAPAVVIPSAQSYTGRGSAHSWSLATWSSSSDSGPQHFSATIPHRFSRVPVTLILTTNQLLLSPSYLNWISTNSVPWLDSDWFSKSSKCSLGQRKIQRNDSYAK